MKLGITEAVEISGRILDLVKKGVTMGLQEEVMNLREAVLNAREENLALRQSKHELTERIAELERKDAQLRNYELVQAVGGAMVYRSAQGLEHYACPKCMEERRVSILQDHNPYNGHFRCPHCQNEFAINAARNRSNPRVIT